MNQGQNFRGYSPKTNFNPYLPDMENPYNNLTINTKEVSDLRENEFKVLCSHCQNEIVVQPDWKMFECGNCHKMNKMPRKLINQLYFSDKLKNVRYNSYKNHLDMILPLPYIISLCPFCKAENRVQNKSDYMTCFICGRTFNIDYTEEKVLRSEKYSLNPNSKYYKYKGSPSTPIYPPARVLRMSERFFPDPVNYDNDYYYNNGTFDYLGYKNFNWDHNSHQMIYNDPRIEQMKGYFGGNPTDYKEVSNDSLMRSLSSKMSERENQRSELYKKLFFTNK